MMKHTTRWSAFLGAVVLNLFVVRQVWGGTYTHALAILWVSSIVLLAVALATKPTRVQDGWNRRDSLIALLLILFTVGARVALYDPTRLNGDDVLTGYFSGQYDLKRQNFFGPIPPNPSDWVSQFPTPYFFLQKLFFVVAGVSPLTLKLSILPYVTVIALMVYMVGKTLINRRFAVLGAVLSAFYFPGLYLETIALHFTASTAVYLVFFFFLLQFLKRPGAANALAMGIAVAANFLFYPSSYIALPVMSVAIIVTSIRAIWRRTIIDTTKTVGAAVIGFFVTLSPFLTYTTRYTDYFTQRTSQLWVFGGSWSPENPDPTHDEVLAVLKEHTLLSLKSLVIDNIGGYGGYYFGSLALLKGIMAILLIAGLLVMIIRLIAKREAAWLFVALTICFSFGAMVFSIMPPAFHRFSVAFPFLSMVMALPLALFLERPRVIPSVVRYGFVLGIAAWFAWYNFTLFRNANRLESDNENLRIARFIATKLPRTQVKIAAFNGYVLDRYVYFVSGGTVPMLETDYHDNLLATFNSHVPYLYIMTMPDAFETKFREKDPQGTFVKISIHHALFTNLSDPIPESLYTRG